MGISFIPVSIQLQVGYDSDECSLLEHHLLVSGLELESELL